MTKRKVLMKKAMMAATTVMMEMMMVLKLVLNALTLPRRLTTPTEMLEHLF
jgi:hypothetical protein